MVRLPSGEEDLRERNVVELLLKLYLLSGEDLLSLWDGREEEEEEQLDQNDGDVMVRWRELRMDWVVDGVREIRNE